MSDKFPSEGVDVRISVVVGNPNPGGRTTTTAVALASKIVGEVGDAEIVVIELADVAGRIFLWEDAELASLTAGVAGSELVIFACPTYKASFTGLLKAFLDRYGSNGLAGVVAIPLMLGAAPIHFLAPESQLRPVLVELAASVPTKAFFMIDNKMEELDAAIDSWWELARQPLLRALGQ
jgi:FMN reductase